MKYILLIAIWVLGFIGGMLFIAIGYAARNVGCLRVDSSDPDGPYIFAEFSKPLSFIRKNKFILMEVKDKDLIEEAGLRQRLN